MGAAYIVLYLVLYFINPSLNFNFTLFIIFTTVLYLFVLIRAGFQQRKRLGGFLGFGEVFVNSIAIYAFGSLIAAVFTAIMFKLDPELIELAKESSKQVMETTFRLSGMSEEQVELAIEEANENQDPNNVTSISAQFIGWIIGIVFPGLIYALIASLVTKKKDKSVA